MDAQHCTDSGIDPIFTELLRLYSKNRTQLYINYFEDFKLLVAWLKPVPPNRNLPRLPWFAGNYEVQELAKILGTAQEEVFKTLEDNEETTL